MRCRPALTLALLAAPAAGRADDLTATVTPDGVEFKAGKEVVAKYVTDPKYPKPFLYPVLAPGGVPVTRGYPVEKGLPGEATTDHVHHKSVWFCHGDVIPEGVELKTKTTDKHGKGVDFWSEAKDKDGTRRHGQMTCVKVGEPKAGKGGVGVETQNEWRTVEGMKIMDETRVVTFRDLPDGRLFAFDITLRATVCPISFGDTKEGSFAIRTHDALRPNRGPDGGTVTTADGKAFAPPQKDNLPIWGQPTAWIDYSGEVDGKKVGIAVFEGPDNAKGGWHVRAYGLNGPNPFGRELSGFPSQKGKTDLVRIEKGGELKLRYAVYAHTGDAKTGKVAEAFELFKK
ncbi:MAG: hypothetical protein C0501_13115 [Isosphaera sp.]|nr:hypothetical protein [Isosphaera sp.]